MLYQGIHTVSLILKPTDNHCWIMDNNLMFEITCWLHPGGGACVHWSVHHFTSSLSVISAAICAAFCIFKGLAQSVENQQACVCVVCAVGWGGVGELFKHTCQILFCSASGFTPAWCDEGYSPPLLCRQERHEVHFCGSVLLSHWDTTGNVSWKCIDPSKSRDVGMSHHPPSLC